MASCVDCGSPLPDNQGISTCSMCYGDIDHGRDAYYLRYAEESTERAAEERRLEKEREIEQQDQKLRSEGT